jgi:hypothetical protein
LELRESFGLQSNFSIVGGTDTMKRPWLKHARRRIGAAALAAMFCNLPVMLAEIKSFSLRGCTLTEEVDLPVSPETAFDLMTGDISPWWDHHIVQSPKALYIEPKAGGGFYEIFDGKGNGARHATVIYADRGKILRLDGPLGLSGRAVTFVTTFEYEKTEVGTRVKLTVNMSGQFDENLEKAVDGVWRHFLIERLKPYVESGQWKKSH